MNEHDCCLASWSWFKGRDNQDELATWHKIFQRSLSPRLEFCKVKSSLDGCDSVLHDDWLDIPWVVILHSFCFKPRMVSDKSTWRNIFTIMFLCSLHKGITAKSESSCYLLKVIALGQKLILEKPSNWWSGFPSNTNLRVPVSRFIQTRFVIFMINICIYSHPFKVFMNRKHERVEDLVCGNVGETN